jgi:hypothetical protein
MPGCPAVDRGLLRAHAGAARGVVERGEGQRADERLVAVVLGGVAELDARQGDRDEVGGRRRRHRQEGDDRHLGLVQEVVAQRRRVEEAGDAALDQDAALGDVLVGGRADHVLGAHVAVQVRLQPGERGDRHALRDEDAVGRGGDAGRGLGGGRGEVLGAGGDDVLAEEVEADRAHARGRHVERHLVGLQPENTSESERSECHSSTEYERSVCPEVGA